MPGSTFSAYIKDEIRAIDSYKKPTVPPIIDLCKYSDLDSSIYRAMYMYVMRSRMFWKIEYGW